MVQLLFFATTTVVAQTGVFSPLAQICNSSLPKVLCIEKYASVMPYHFFRPVSNGTSTPTFGSTSVPNDTSFGLVNSSDFLVFDRERGLELLGPSSSYEFVFDVSKAVHEAPVYVAAQNKLYLSRVIHHSKKPLQLDDGRLTKHSFLHLLAFFRNWSSISIKTLLRCRSICPIHQSTRPTVGPSTMA